MSRNPFSPVVGKIEQRNKAEAEIAAINSLRASVATNEEAPAVTEETSPKEEILGAKKAKKTEKKK